MESGANFRLVKERERGGQVISHEIIYKHLWENKSQGWVLYKELRHCGKKYNKRMEGGTLFGTY